MTPAAKAAMEKRNVPAAYTVACRYSLARNISAVSYTMDDIVVKPPQNPVVRARRISGVMVSPRADSPVRMPITRHPSTFAASVPIGQLRDNRCEVTLSPYRATEPANPPKPTSKDKAHGLVILVF